MLLVERKQKLVVKSKLGRGMIKFDSLYNGSIDFDCVFLQWIQFKQYRWKSLRFFQENLGVTEIAPQYFYLGNPYAKTLHLRVDVLRCEAY